MNHGESNEADRIATADQIVALLTDLGVAECPGCSGAVLKLVEERLPKCDRKARRAA